MDAKVVLPEWRATEKPQYGAAVSCSSRFLFFPHSISLSVFSLLSLSLPLVFFLSHIPLFVFTPLLSSFSHPSSFSFSLFNSVLSWELERLVLDMEWPKVERIIIVDAPRAALASPQGQNT